MIIHFIGKILREKFPQLYKTLLRIKFEIKKNNYIYISDNLGSSFKDYISENNMNIILNKLKENLDDDSIKTIDVIYKRILNYPEFSYKQILIPNNENIIGGLLKEEKVIFKPKKLKSYMELL